MAIQQCAAIAQLKNEMEQVVDHKIDVATKDVITMDNFSDMYDKFIGPSHTSTVEY